MRTAIHVSPHPDDESIAVPCTLLSLKDAGWRVINLTCSLGRPDDWPRRREELDAAIKVAGFDNEVLDAPVAISRHDDLRLACRHIAKALATLIAATGAELVIGPHPRDGHHGHATVARAIRHTMGSMPQPLVWWMWSIWVDLPQPTTVVSCDPEHLLISEKMLEQYQGEYGRNDYRIMHRPVREVNAIRGVERVFGYGSEPRQHVRVEHAELLTELTRRGRKWMIGAPRVLEVAEPTSVWLPLTDSSILSTSRLRPFYRPTLLAVSTRVRWTWPEPRAAQRRDTRAPGSTARSSVYSLSIRKPRAR